MKLLVETQDWAAMPSLPAGFVLSSFAQAIAVTPAPSSSPSDPKNTIYKADIKLPHGGYLLALLANTVRLHFTTQHPSLNQPDLITSHVEFLARSTTGPADICVQQLKLGRQFSVVRVQLLQYPSSAGNSSDSKPSSPAARICIEALITQGNLTTEALTASGPSLPTRPFFADPANPMPRIEDCEVWTAMPEWRPIRPAAFKTTKLIDPLSNKLGVDPNLGPSVSSIWVKWEPGVGHDIDGVEHGFSVVSLTYLADAFRPLPEAYGVTGCWYPTLSYSVEVKKAPPTERGWEWLFMRIEMRVVKDGRFDIDLVIAEEGGDIVALSKHTALIVPAARNYKAIAPKI